MALRSSSRLATKASSSGSDDSAASATATATTPPASKASKAKGKATSSPASTSTSPVKSPATRTSGRSTSTTSTSSNSSSKSKSSPTAAAAASASKTTKQLTPEKGKEKEKEKVVASVGRGRKRSAASVSPEKEAPENSVSEEQQQKQQQSNVSETAEQQPNEPEAGTSAQPAEPNVASESSGTVAVFKTPTLPVKKYKGDPKLRLDKVTDPFFALPTELPSKRVCRPSIRLMASWGLNVPGEVSVKPKTPKAAGLKAIEKGPGGARTPSPVKGPGRKAAPRAITASTTSPSPTSSSALVAVASTSQRSSTALEPAAAQLGDSFPIDAMLDTEAMNSTEASTSSKDTLQNYRTGTVHKGRQVKVAPAMFSEQGKMPRILGPKSKRAALKCQFGATPPPVPLENQLTDLELRQYQLTQRHRRKMALAAATVKAANQQLKQQQQQQQQQQSAKVRVIPSTSGPQLTQQPHQLPTPLQSSQSKQSQQQQQPQQQQQQQQQKKKKKRTHPETFCGPSCRQFGVGPDGEALPPPASSKLGLKAASSALAGSGPPRPPKSITFTDVYARRATMAIKNNFLGWVNGELKLYLGEERCRPLYNLPNDVPCWTPSDVRLFVEVVGFPVTAARMERNGVNGVSLLLLKFHDVCPLFTLRPPADSRLFSFILRLHQNLYYILMPSAGARSLQTIMPHAWERLVEPPRQSAEEAVKAAAAAATAAAAADPDPDHPVTTATSSAEETFSASTASSAETTAAAAAAAETETSSAPAAVAAAAEATLEAPATTETAPDHLVKDDQEESTVTIPIASF